MTRTLRPTRRDFLSFSLPWLDEEEIVEVVDTLRSDWITTGPKVRLLEEKFAAFVDAPGAVAVNSGTGALHVALATLGIGPGDVVFTSPLTFCSDAHVIEHVGATLMLVDVEPDTLNLDPERLKQAIASSERRSRPKARAVIPVHYAGHPCDMRAVLEIAATRELRVIEDAAHALPARQADQVIGSAGGAGVPRLVCFSFYATKNLTTAEGGMITGHPELLEEARLWSLHGMSRDAWKRHSDEGSWYYDVIRPGFKYNMTDIQAAIGLHQLDKLPQFQARRREIAKGYSEAFKDLEQVEIPAERADVEHAWHLYVIRLNLESLRITRNQFIDELKARNIGTSVHFIPIHLHSYYRNKYGFKPDDFPVAHREYQRMISLPLYPRMDDQDVEDVIEAVADVAMQFSA